MGTGASADIASRVQAASADELRSSIGSLDTEGRAKLRSAFNEHDAIKIFDALDDYSAFVYSFFPGTYYSKRLKEKKLDALVSSTWFAGSVVVDSNEVASEAPGIRCMMIEKGDAFVVVFRGSDLGRAVADGEKKPEIAPNVGDLAADTDLCDRPDNIAWEESDYAQQVEALAKMLNEQGKRCIFTGHSLGGVLALLAAKHHPDSVAIAFGGLAVRGGWRVTLGQSAVARSVNYFDADDPFLVVYGNPAYGNDCESTDWLVTIGQSAECDEPGSPLAKDIMEESLGKSGVFTNDDVLKEVTNKVRTRLDKLVEDEHYAGGYMKLMACDASVHDKGIGVRLLSDHLGRDREIMSRRPC